MAVAVSEELMTMMMMMGSNLVLTVESFFLSIFTHSLSLSFWLLIVDDVDIVSCLVDYCC